MTNPTTHGQVPEALQQGYDAARLEIDSLKARVQELGAMLRETATGGLLSWKPN